MKQMIKKMTVVLSVALVCAPMGAMAANKLIVKDATGTNDVMVVTDTGYIGVGNALPSSALSIKGTGVVQSQILSHFTGLTTASGGGGMVAYHNNAAGALPNNGDRLGYMFFGTMDGATARNAAGLAARAEGAFSSTSTPSAFVFETVPTGSVTRAERMRINSAGNVGVGTNAPTQKLEVNGGVRLNTAIAKQTCTAGVRGTLWFTQIATAGQADTLEICSKLVNGTYAWVAVF